MHMHVCIMALYSLDVAAFFRAQVHDFWYSDVTCLRKKHTFISMFVTHWVRTMLAARSTLGLLATRAQSLEKPHFWASSSARASRAYLSVMEHTSAASISSMQRCRMSKPSPVHDGTYMCSTRCIFQAPSYCGCSSHGTQQMCYDAHECRSNPLLARQSNMSRSGAAVHTWPF